MGSKVRQPCDIRVDGGMGGSDYHRVMRYLRHGCTSCELKFFVPKELMKDPDAARTYLLSKFDQHTCKFADERAKTLANRW